MKRPTSAQRAKLLAALRQILAAADFAPETLPVHVYLTKATRQKGWNMVVRAATNSKSLGGFVTLEFFSSILPQSQTTTIVRRLRAWADIAWSAGMRSAHHRQNDVLTAHELIAAEAIAQGFDQPADNEQMIGQRQPGQEDHS